MSLVAFDDLPDNARLWVFAADRSLSPQERDQAVAAIHTGLAAWNAHGSPVTWGYQTVHDQFLMVGVDETHTELSGCSIDHAVHQIQELEKQLELSFLDHSRIFFREAGQIRVVSRSAFRDLAEAGKVIGETTVFNNTVSSLRELRERQWELPLHQSWHARAFPVHAS